MRESFGELIISPVYETPSEGFNGNPFYNLVIGFYTSLELDEIKIIFKNIEEKNGRVRTQEKFISRTLDIDLICYGDFVDDDGQAIPHKDIELYAYVLKPLLDVAPNDIHPKLKISFLEIWEKFPDEKKKLKKVSLSF